MSQFSYGEQAISVLHRHCAIVRALDVYPLGAVFPRLGLRLGFTLKELEPDHTGTAITGYELRELAGELRLTEHGDAIGPLQWVGQRRNVRSSKTSYEHHIETAIDLDPWRLEKLERWRNGGVPQFWLQLWPSFRQPNDWYDADVQPFRVTVPRDAWLKVLEGIEQRRYGVLEVPFSEPDASLFQCAMEELKTAHRELLDGRYAHAVGGCRLAIDAMFTVLNADGDRPLDGHLQGIVDGARAKAYAQVLTGLKNATHVPHHTSSTRREFTREEALFVVQTTQHYLALAGSLVTRRAASA